MTTTRRVAITGIGILSSLGRGESDHLDAVINARSGIAPIDRFDTSGFRCTIAAQVPERSLGDLPRDVDRVSGYALLAAADAIAQARLDASPVPRERIATAIGTALGGSETLDAGYRRLYGDGESRLHPLTIPEYFRRGAG